MPNLFSESKTPISSSKLKSVFLHQWWLIKVERESKLGIGGVVNRETLETRGMRVLGSASAGKMHNVRINDDGVQVFGSAAIAKRHDNNTLEAVDGIIIRISGFINKSRTLSYSFSTEVCDSFLTGFPCSWEDYASKSFNDECGDTTKQSLPVSFDDLPVTHVRDLLMSQPESRALTSIIFKDILKHTEIIRSQSVPTIEKISKNSIETEVDHNQDDDVSLSNPNLKMTEEDYKIPVDSHMEKSEETEDCGFKDILEHTEKSLNQSDLSVKKISNNSIETEVDHNRDDVSLSNATQKITEEDCKIPVDSHMEKAEETEDGFMSDEIHKITQEKQSKARRYPLRSMRKRSRS